MRVLEVMSEPVETIPADMRLAEARNLMNGLHLHHLIVKDAGKIVGVLSASDVVNPRRGVADDKARAGDVMSVNVASIDQHETVRRAANMMQGRNIGCLAVTHEGKLVGIVTVSDLLRLFGKGGERRASAPRASLHYRVPHRKQRTGSRW